VNLAERLGVSFSGDPRTRGFRAELEGSLMGARVKSSCDDDAILERTFPLEVSSLSQPADLFTQVSGRTKRRSDDIAHREDAHPFSPIQPASTLEGSPDAR